MAGDWIKMQKSLPRDPRVIRIASALNADRLRTVGGLFSAWCLFDEQTETGIVSGYTPELLDELVAFPGLARAMESVGWLEIGEDFLAVPRFDEHNGQSAKRRAQDRNRKMSARNADKCPPAKQTESGLEKSERREDHIPSNPQEGAKQSDMFGSLKAEIEDCLPKDWTKLDKNERKQTRVNSNSPTMLSIGTFFGRKASTLWTVAEALSVLRLNPPTDEIETLGRYYSLVIAKTENYRRHDLPTLLNNWVGEVDRARSYFANNAAA